VKARHVGMNSCGRDLAREIDLAVSSLFWRPRSSCCALLSPPVDLVVVEVGRVSWVGARVLVAQWPRMGHHLRGVQGRQQLLIGEPADGRRLVHVIVVDGALQAGRRAASVEKAHRKRGTRADIGGRGCHGGCGYGLCVVSSRPTVASSRSLLMCARSSMVSGSIDGMPSMPAGTTGAVGSFSAGRTRPLPCGGGLSDEGLTLSS
jgi:hypothetical protein